LNGILIFQYGLILKVKCFNLRPRDVIKNPGKYSFHDQRIENADILYPIEMMFTVDRYAILDGIHRLVRYYKLGINDVQVRIIPENLLSEFMITMDTSLYQ